MGTGQKKKDVLKKSELAYFRDFFVGGGWGIKKLKNLEANAGPNELLLGNQRKESASQGR